tara:strand:+ start:612 stop:767 length:156 start_codon:yes stop_codon:yes gene_type:complete
MNLIHGVHHQEDDLQFHPEEDRYNYHPEEDGLQKSSIKTRVPPILLSKMLS